MQNVLSFDIEEYFQVENFKAVIGESQWQDHESRLHIGLSCILNILKNTNAKATFFVLGWTAERYPDLIQEIAKGGHEIASHGFSHELIYKQTPAEFAEDLKRSLKVLEPIAGRKIKSYRAPSFSITEKSKWALEVLMDHGIEYDSSIFPIHHDRYGMPDCNPMPHVILEKPGRQLKEFPISTVQYGKLRLPFSGGGYFRLLPLCMTKHFVRKLNNEGVPVMIYLHPWEFDPKQPRVEASFLSRFRHYLNLDRTESRLRQLLNGLDVTTIEDYFESHSEVCS